MIDELKQISQNEETKENSNEFMNYQSKINLSYITEIYKLIKTIGLKHLLTNSKITTFILFFLAYLLFFLSLGKCDFNKYDCPRKIGWMILKIVELIISCIFLFILIELILYSKISRLHLIHIIVIFSLFYTYSHGFDFDDHGFFNFVGYFSLLFIIIIFFIPFNILICIIQCKSTILKVIYTMVLSTFIISIIYLYHVNIIDCDDWPKGLNNSFIDNNSSKYGCQIVFPKICPYRFLSKFQDYTKILGKKCENNKLFGSKENILMNSKSPFLNEKANRIGYPLTNKDPSCNLDFIDGHNLLVEYLYKNLVDMDNKVILDKYYKDKMPEIEVDFTNNTQGKMIINVNFNETLSKQRTLLENENIPYSNNIMVLYIDSVSRANSMRNLKKTTKFFEKFMSIQGGFNKKYPSEVYHSFQFFKYHSFQLLTSANFPILFSGQPRFSKNVFITKYLKKNGYITGYTQDFCYKDNFRIYHNSTLEEVYDHQFLICDPNDDNYNTYTLNCLYGKPTAQHLFDYGLQFWKKYKNNRKFLTIISNAGHEGTLESLKYIDDIIYNFLYELFNNNSFKDSTIFLLSDHGVGMPSIYYWYNFYSIEKNLPMLYILVNDRKNLTYEQQYKYIYENQQTFITGFDIYNTFGNIIFGDDYSLIKNKTFENDTAKSEFGISLFDYINPKLRTPEIYQFSSTINKKYCK